MEDDRVERTVQIAATTQRESDVRIVTTPVLDRADELIAALAEPNRRLLLEHLAAHGVATTTTPAAERPVTRQAVAQQLAVLESVDLVSSGRPTSRDQGARRGVHRLAAPPAGEPCSAM